MGFTKKQKQNRNILVGIAIIVGAIILINYFGGGGKFLSSADGIESPPVVPSGCESSILSMDDVQISRTGTDIGESVFQLTLSSREAGQCVYGYLDSNELEQEIESKIGKDVEIKYSNPFQITLKRLEKNKYFKVDLSEPDKVVKNYKYTPSTSPIATFKTKNGCEIGSISPRQKNCKNQAQEKGYSNSQCAVINAGKTSCVGWNFETYSNLYRAESDRLQEKIQVMITTGDGEVKSATLDTDQNIDDIVRSGVDNYFTFEGFLLGTKALPESIQVATISGENRIVGLNAGSSSSQADECKKRFLGLWTKQESCMMEYNKNVKIGFKELYPEAEIIGREIKVPISKDAVYSVIKLQVKAKWLGIYEPVAEPELSNCQGVNLEYRNKGESFATYDLKIKEGTGSQGSFNIQSSCEDGFQVQPEEKTKTIVGTESISGKISVKQMENADSSSQCTLTASIKRLDFSAEDSCTFTATGIKSCRIVTESCSTNTDCCEGLSCNGGVCQKTPNVEICYNQEDDDNDDLVDCFDRDCKDSTYCGGTKNETFACISEGQTISKDQECCAGLEKKKTGFFLFRFLKSEGTCEIKLPKCADDDAFVRSKVLGDIFPKLKCDGTFFQKINPLAYIKLILVPIVFLFELLFTPAMIGRYFKRGKGFAWLIGLILAGIVAYVFYTSWVMGLIFIGILLFFQITAGVISLFKKR